MTLVRRFLIGLAIFAVWISIDAIATVQAQSPSGDQAATTQRFEVEYAQGRIAEWNKQLDDIEAELDGDEVSSRVVTDARSIAEQITGEALALKTRASERLERTNAAKSKLGDPPAEGENEVPAVAEERDRLNKDVANVGGILKQIELVNFRASELQDRLSTLARERFTRRILGRVDVPTEGGVWLEGWDQLLRIPSMVRARYANVELDGKVGDQLGEIAPGLVLLAFVVMAALIGGEVIVLRYIPRRWKAMPHEDHVALISGTRFVFTALVPGIALLVAYRMISGQPNLLSGSMGDFVNQCFGAALFLLFVGAAIRSIHSPFSPVLRRSGTTDRGARVVGLCSLAAALIFAWDMILLQGATTLGTSLDLALVQSISNVLVISVLLFVSSLGVFWIHDERDRHEFWAKLERRSRRVVKIISIGLPILMALGYVALARFLLENLMMAGAFLTCYWLLRGFARALMHTYLVPPESSDETAGADAVHGTLYFWMRVMIDVGMVVIAVPIAVMIFSDIAWVDLVDVVERAFIGIQIGGIHISLRAILLAVLMFVVVLGLMRFLQRMLSTRVLPNTKLDQGLQHSVSAIFGYIGICLAVLLAISAAGMDLSNLAIIAGAISVGIGFGMQSIVNNFVSGLILLVERPIKVGDWIVVGADQGYVKDIRVRATEIETFDRSSVVIPNSELISNRVLNWTLKDRSGRGILKIGVSYGSDVEKVRDILLEMADKRREILSYPAPQVVFMDFGASSLDFELRYFLRDIGDVLAVGSSIRFEVIQRFREEGIEIPFPQRDVNLRDVDKLTDAIREAGQGRSRRQVAKTDEDRPSDGSRRVLGDGAEQQAAPPSDAKDVSRDRDAAGRSIPDAGGGSQAGDADQGDNPR